MNDEEIMSWYKTDIQPRLANLNDEKSLALIGNLDKIANTAMIKAKNKYNHKIKDQNIQDDFVVINFNVFKGFRVGIVKRVKHAFF